MTAVEFEPAHLPAHASRRWTDEQRSAIERRDGDLLLTAGAGSGKTSVLVERFARTVIEDGVPASAILAITFTEKAAAEMRERVRLRLRELGADAAARETEDAAISTIHGFCARLLRAHALAAQIDPAFAVLEPLEAERISDAAFAGAIEAAGDEVVELIAAYGAAPLRSAITAVHAELRSRGETLPDLPPLPAPDAGLDLAATRARLREAAATVAAELGGVEQPGVRVVQALDRLGRCDAMSEGEPWPGALDPLRLPGGNGAALSTEACERYTEALAAFRRTCEHHHAARVHAVLARLLRAYGERYRAGKASVSGLDFDDLELMARDLLRARPDLAERYRMRFQRVMVDELQDTNAVQLELIGSVSDGNLFTVGDAQQSIYGFRHADVALFDALAAQREAAGLRETLRTNFRSRPEILAVVNRAFARVFGEGFIELVAGREIAETPGALEAEPRVEVLIVDKGADWKDDGLAAPWRLAEARALAGRVAALIADGTAPGEIVVLCRATTDLRTYERALEDRGVPTYVIGGRGYWRHPQVVDLVAYLRALANPLDEEALYTALVSPLVGVSLDAVVAIAAAARAQAAPASAWGIVSTGIPAQLNQDDRARLEDFVGWFTAERTGSSHHPLETLIDRALVRSGYDLAMLALPGGRRRLANVRKLMRLAREYEDRAGRDLRGFLDLTRGRDEGRLEDRESEAPVEGEALDAVRLMTIHRAKGLEFPVVCVADLGRSPWRPVPLMRIGRDGRFGLRLSRPGGGRAVPALDYVALGDEAAQGERAEEQRLLYVAMTRARERLIVSGAHRFANWSEKGDPLGWLAGALAPEIAGWAADDAVSEVVQDGVRLRLLRGESEEAAHPATPPTSPSEPTELPPPPPAPVASEPARSPLAVRLSYSALTAYGRCPYRFYVERVLEIPPALEPPAALPGAGGNADGALTAGAAGLSALERGSVLHALLERLDFRRPIVGDVAGLAPGLDPVEAAELAALAERFAAGELCRRLGRAVQARREVPFTFLLADTVVTGVFDVLAREPGDHHLVVDYKTDRLENRSPSALAAGRYAVQRLIYALASLRAGAASVEVVHLFLEAPDRPVTARFAAGDRTALEAELTERAAPLLRGEFPVTSTPERRTCAGCPAEGGLCSWPPAMTRRDAADRLF